jgi:NifU-like protein involved in Fe-S cluster formation
VAKFPLRVKCASLAWHALHAALQSKSVEVPTVSTDVEGAGPGEGA